MNRTHNRAPAYGTLLHKVGAGIWMAIIVLTGTYIRVRESDVTPETDWLVLAQLITCGIGTLLGFTLIRRARSAGHAPRLGHARGPAQVCRDDPLLQ